MKLLAAIVSVMSLLGLYASAQLAPLKASDPVKIELKTPSEDASTVSSTYVVSATGTLKLPMLDREIHAQGLTTTELARRIEAAYKAAEIYTNPTINCNMDIIAQDQGAAHIVAVGGEVRSPKGNVALRDNMRLYNAIMQCGGPTEFAKMSAVKLIRGTKEYRFDMRKLDPNGRNNPILQDGDTIHIPNG